MSRRLRNNEQKQTLDEHENVANQILYQYDRNNRLCREYTAHEGAVDVDSTPFIEHGYDSVQNGLKPISLTYPSGKEISYGYDFAGRVTTISDGILLRSGDTGGSGSGSGSGGPVLPPVIEEDVIVRYAYRGLGPIAKMKCVRPDLTLDYTASGALDRFGRITDHAWKSGAGTNVVRIKHDYDLADNRLSRTDMMNSAWSETYAYDEMDQIASMQRTGHSESWQYDATGNWLSYTKNGSTENRIHNAVNEVLNICAHDAGGNMTQMPKPNGDGVLNCVYDAWNRMVAVNENIRYRYDGRNFRIEKIVEQVSTKSFFNRSWQELESRTDGISTTYVWGLRYIDDLICRERNEERLYSLADPNWNAVAAVAETGVVQERFYYDAFGQVRGLNSDWNRTFTGQVLDAETGLMLYRNRFYHGGLGRFTSRDPIGYDAKDVNVFRYVFNRTVDYVDIDGTFFQPGTPLFADCVRNCEDDCYNQFGRGWWYPGKYAQYTICVAACPSSCRDQDFTFCNYVNNWPPCYKEGLKCAGLLAEIGDMTLGLIPGVGAITGGIDCALDAVTTMQFYCKSPHKDGLSNDVGFMNQLLQTMADCGLAVASTVFSGGLKLPQAILQAILASVEEYNLSQNDGGTSFDACNNYLCNCRN